MRKGWWICQPVPYIQNVKYERPTRQENLRKCEDRHISITTLAKILKTSCSNFSSLVFSFVGHIKFPQSYYCKAHHQPLLFSFSLYLLNVQKHLRVINWYYITWYSINFVLVLPKEMLIKREWFSLLFWAKLSSQ